MAPDPSSSKRPFPFLPGLRGLVRGELSRWLGRRGLVHLLAWTLGIQGVLYFDTVVNSDVLDDWRGFDGLIHLWWIGAPLAAIAVAQSALIEERHNETAPWVLSKPVARAAFVVAKIVGDAVGLIAFAVLLQGTLVYAWMPAVTPEAGLAINRPDLGRFLVVIGVQSLVIVFFVTMTVFLTTLVKWRGAVAGVGLITWIVLWSAPREEIETYTIGGLVTGELGDINAMKPIAEYLVFDRPLEPISSILWTAVAALAFTVLGAVIFRREQF